jgi:hypothetical protein
VCYAWAGARVGARCDAAASSSFLLYAADRPRCARWRDPVRTSFLACAVLLSQPLGPPVARGQGVAQDERATGGGVEAHHLAPRDAGGASRSCIASPQDHRTTKVQLRPGPFGCPALVLISACCACSDPRTRPLQYKWRSGWRTKGRRLAWGRGTLPGTGCRARLRRWTGAWGRLARGLGRRPRGHAMGRGRRCERVRGNCDAR